MTIYQDVASAVADALGLEASNLIGMELKVTPYLISVNVELAFDSDEALIKHVGRLIS